MLNNVFKKEYVRNKSCPMHSYIIITMMMGNEDNNNRYTIIIIVVVVIITRFYHHHHHDYDAIPRGSGGKLAAHNY